MQFQKDSGSIVTNSLWKRRQEEKKNWVGKSAYPVEHVSPSLKGDTLEDREHGKPKVVKVGDAKVWTFPKLTALGTFRTLIVASAKRWVVFINHYSCKQYKIDYYISLCIKNLFV